MLSVLSLSSAHTNTREDGEGFDPGFFTFIVALVDGVRRQFSERFDAAAAAMIEANGGRLTDSLERHIAYAHVVGSL